MSRPDGDGLSGMTTTVRAIIATPDLDRLLAFYRGLLDATEVDRVPAEGPAFYVGLRIGNSDLGLVADAEVDLQAPQRMLISVDVPDVDALLPRVTALGGGAPAPAHDMPWGQRVAHVLDPDGNTVNLTQDLGSGA